MWACFRAPLFLAAIPSCFWLHFTEDTRPPPVIDEAGVETHIADNNFVCLFLISKTKTNKHHEVDDLEIRKDFEHHSHFSGLL